MKRHKSQLPLPPTENDHTQKVDPALFRLYAGSLKILQALKPWVCDFSSSAPPKEIIQNEIMTLFICIYPTIFLLYLPAPVRETGWSIRYLNLFLRTGLCQTWSTERGRVPWGEKKNHEYTAEGALVKWNLFFFFFFYYLRISFSSAWFFFFSKFLKENPSWTLLPPPSPYHPSGSSQCTNPKHPASCIEPGLAWMKFILNHFFEYIKGIWILFRKNIILIG